MCAGAFLCAQAAVAATADPLGWISPPRVLEAAAALAVAYFAWKILFLPDAQHRRTEFGSTGCFRGLLPASTAMKAPYFLSGAISTEGLTVIADGAVGLRCVNGTAERLSEILSVVGAWRGSDCGRSIVPPRRTDELNPNAGR